MKKTKRWLLMCAALIGLMAHAGALRGSSLTLRGANSTTTTTTTEAPPEEETTVPAPTSAPTKNRTLTGIPQIDYVWDPNLPRELNGYNLSDYPFLSTNPPPDEVEFKCTEDLHDGFYSSVQYKCQVYHHCLYGVRSDFLCPNFTAFDQRTFICHFASEVDCKNSHKYWNKNDALYMATTTKAPPTTTTLEPPYRPRPNRPRRPLRRRRPIDYYYDDEEYDDDYFEERMNRRRKNRPRTRRPDYDDDYEDERMDRKPVRGRDSEDDEDTNDRRKSERPRSRNRTNSPTRNNDDDMMERRKPAERKRPGLADRRQSEERRSFSDDRDRGAEERRPLNGRRRPSGGNRRPAAPADDYDRPRHRDDFDDEQPEEEKVLVKPSGSGSSSFGGLFDRPRTAPRIARPVPLNERKKFDYSNKAVSTTTSRPADDEYYDDLEELPAEDVSEKPHTDVPRNIQPDRNRKNEDRFDEKEPPATRKSYVEQSTRRAPLAKEDRPEKSIYRMRPISSIVSQDESRSRTKPAEPEQDDYEDRSQDYMHRTLENSRRTSLKGREREDEEVVDSGRRSPYKSRDKEIVSEEDVDSGRRNPYRSRDKAVAPADDVDSRKGSFKNRDHDVLPDVDLESEEKISRPRLKVKLTRTKSDRIQLPVDLDAQPEVPEEKFPPTGSAEDPPIRDAKPTVRIVKRPFLPSRGGSPYLPRGLQPVGGGQKQSSTESTPIDMGSTISGVRLLEHGAPLTRGGPQEDRRDVYNGPRTTLPPQVDPPKVNLDELFENDYDVTLNDALNPTLKPLTSNRNYPSSFTSLGKYDRNRFSVPSYNSDSYYASTDNRQSAVRVPLNSRQDNHRGVSRVAQQVYDDYEY